MKTIAVDFDGTITKYSPYPIMGDIRPQIKPFLQKLHDNGYRLVLYTCRTGKYYNEALVALQQHDLYDLFDWDMENRTASKECGKVVASFYLDDRALLLNFDDIDWDWLYEKIVEFI